MTTDSETRIRQALRGLAEAEPVDEVAGWQQLRARLDGAGARRGRGRTAFLAGGLALAAAAAAALVVVTNESTPPEAIDVGPAATAPDPAPTTDSTTVTEPEPPRTEISPTTGPVPERPLAVVLRDDLGEFAGIAVFDADTGAHLGTPVGWTGFSYGDVSIAPDGALWFTEEHGDTSAVTRVAWGSTDHDTPFGDESSSPALSPDGSTLAYLHRGVTVEDPSLRIVDLASGTVLNELRWRPDEPDFFRTQGSMHGLEWSPDGTRLLFVSSYEGSEVLAIDPQASTLSDAVPLVDADAPDAHWASNTSVVLIDRCCYPEHTNNEVQLHDLTTGAVEVLDAGSSPRDVDVSRDGAIAILTDEGDVSIDGRRVDLPADAAAIAF